MTAPHPEIIIVKRHGPQEDGHHGGAWKIAFADFMTAMMAFFLVLWIISATDKNTKTLIARYFNPVKLEEPARAQKGIHGVSVKDAPYAPGEETASPSAGKPSAETGEASGKADQNPASPSADNGQARPPTPIRPCRSRNCSAILARASTRSPAPRRPGRASTLRRR